MDWRESKLGMFSRQPEVSFIPGHGLRLIGSEQRIRTWRKRASHSRKRIPAVRQAAHVLLLLLTFAHADTVFFVYRTFRAGSDRARDTMRITYRETYRQQAGIGLCLPSATRKQNR